MPNALALAARTLGLALLYVLAAPTYLVVAIVRFVKSAPARRTLQTGAIVCPHCGETNDLDVKATCPRCRRTELGNRLRCSCGYVARSFDCDFCGVTIDVL